MRVTLNDMTVRNLKATGRQQTYFCNRTPNFGVRVSQAGGKSFFYLQGKERRRVHLGKYPETSLADARRKLSGLTTQPHTALSYREATELYLQTYVRPNYRPRSAKEVERLLNKLSDRPLHDISTRHITDLLDKLPPSEANHTFGVLRTFFNWCERRDLIARSPVAKLTKPHKETSRDRVLTIDEIRRVWTAAGDGSFGCIIKLCLLTGQRRGQLAAIQPSWILGNASIVFPAGIMKAKRDHSIPLTPFSLKLATALSQMPPQRAWSAPKARLDELSGIRNWTLHDLRRTCSTNLGAMNIPPHVIDAILGHKKNTLHGTYNRHLYFDEMRAALCLWEERLLQIVGETPTS